MDMIDEMLEKCTVIDHKKVSDGEGGWYYAWADGVEFMAAIVLESAAQAVIAERQSGIKKIYYVTTPKNAILSSGNVFRRESNKRTYRVTSDGADATTPESSEMSFSQVTAEDWPLPAAGDVK